MEIWLLKKNGLKKINDFCQPIIVGNGVFLSKQQALEAAQAALQQKVRYPFRLEQRVLPM